jgi:predicted flavoprotein YhiN
MPTRRRRTSSPPTPDFCRPALERYTPRDFIRLVESHGIAWHEKTLGQLFCDKSSLQIIEMLRAECAKGRVEWWQPCDVHGVRQDGGSSSSRPSRASVEPARSSSQPGGLTVPKIGATPFAYKVAEQFGLAVVPPKPALVPLSFEPHFLEHFAELSGCRSMSRRSARAGDSAKPALHPSRSLGPAILQISSYWQQAAPPSPIRLNILPGFDSRNGSRRKRVRTLCSRRSSPSACRSASRSAGAPPAVWMFPLRK